MATSIFFTESKDFKLIKERILSQEDYYLVYIYADTSNIKIPKELIKELPVYGNNLIWVDTAHMDSNAISHHMVLTVGQLMDPEEEIDFFIVSKSVKYEKTVLFLRNQGIPAELIAGITEKPAAKKTKGAGRRGRPKKADQAGKPASEGKKRGRPKKVQSVPETAKEEEKPKKRGRKKSAVTEGQAPEVKASKKRGRPKKAAAAVTEPVPQESKKRGRPAKEKPKKVATKKAKKTRKPAKPKKIKKPAVKEGPKPSKPRKEKPITEADVTAKLAAFQIEDDEVKHPAEKLFAVNKARRPKLKAKLIHQITADTTWGVVNEMDAERIVNRMKEQGMLDIDESSQKIHYKD